MDRLILRWDWVGSEGWDRKESVHLTRVYIGGQMDRLILRWDWVGSEGVGSKRVGPSD